jgi:hypothetical protein
MVEDRWFIPMEQVIMEIGFLVKNKERVKKAGLMVLTMKESTSRIWNMVRVYLNGKMGLLIKESLDIIQSRAKVNIVGLMVEHLMGLG